MEIGEKLLFSSRKLIPFFGGMDGFAVGDFVCVRRYERAAMLLERKKKYRDHNVNSRVNICGGVGALLRVNSRKCCQGINKNIS